MEEFAFIDWIRRQLPPADDRVRVGPGDDCAVVRVGEEQLLVTTDQCADGVHLILRECGPEQAGYKVMARSLSDIAAMAGRPIAAVATVAVPRGMAEADVQSLYRGMRRAGDAFDCPIVGGDVAAWDGPLLMTVTIWGRPIGPEPILRRGARPGDAICVTGDLGGSLLSGKHLAFTPRLAEAETLARGYPLAAMIDLSDGLASDVGHICRESGVGAELAAATIPISPAAATSDDPVAAALNDGEDYELLFTLGADAAEQLLADQPLAVHITRIGTICPGNSVLMVAPDGTKVPLAQTGFQHRT